MRGVGKFEVPRVVAPVPGSDPVAVKPTRGTREHFPRHRYGKRSSPVSRGSPGQPLPSVAVAAMSAPARNQQFTPIHYPPGQEQGRPAAARR